VRVVDQEHRSRRDHDRESAEDEARGECRDQRVDPAHCRHDAVQQSRAEADRDAGGHPDVRVDLKPDLRPDDARQRIHRADRDVEAARDDY
jgi:hypothetical protein